MGKHERRNSDHNTDAGRPYGDLNAEERAAEFDASHAEPVDYARRNFGAAPESKTTRNTRTGQ